MESETPRPRPLLVAWLRKRLMETHLIKLSKDGCSGIGAARSSQLEFLLAFDSLFVIF